jgi:hypothetical protein
MGNVTLPTPVALAGGAICLLGGYLVGVVAGPETPSRTTGVVDTYDVRTGELCLSGDAVADHPAADESGLLCGVWRRTEGDASAPEPGDLFRFVTMVVGPADEAPSPQEEPATVIYGDVVH